MKLLLILPLILLNGCSWTSEGHKQCVREHGPGWSYNGFTEECVVLGGGGGMMPFMLMNPSMNDSHRVVAPQIPMTPMNRCNTLVIGNQLTTSCY